MPNSNVNKETSYILLEISDNSHDEFDEDYFDELNDFEMLEQMDSFLNSNGI